MKAILFFLTLAGAGWGIWWKIDGRVKEGEKATGERVAAVEAKAEKALAELAAHRLHTAETYITKAGMREATESIMEAISGVKHAVDNMTARVDRIVENQPRRATRGG
ncbi:hypothetical protein [Ferirhizobium litorale]|uniref:Uncharacterized protein n=1 Tax=Ferirhizobium litorale TaxID=2927786 RepID=A0AAE3QHS6_9HYPH|nr:hypothetical protein [Fererhizobium litorale]MDI7923419.1 hypothetical protein [Fererhizobium litorale]